MRMPNPKIIVPLIAVAVFVSLFREPWRQQITERALLANSAPPAEIVADMIEQAANLPEYLLAAWPSGKIVQRKVAAREVGRLFPGSRALPPQFESVLLAAAFDPEMNVRETAMGILGGRHILR